MHSLAGHLFLKPKEFIFKTGGRGLRKVKILREHQRYLEWLDSLQSYSEEEGRKPYREGKWSPKEIIMHLAEWDRFTLENRLPRMKEGEIHERYPDFQEFNAKAAATANKQTFKQTLAHAKEQRTKIMEQLQKVDETEWEKIFYIGEHPMSIRRYFTDFIEHDLHHKVQISGYL